MIEEEEGDAGGGSWEPETDDEAFLRQQSAFLNSPGGRPPAPEPSAWAFGPFRSDMPQEGDAGGGDWSPPSQGNAGGGDWSYQAEPADAFVGPGSAYAPAAQPFGEPGPATSPYGGTAGSQGPVAIPFTPDVMRGVNPVTGQPSAPPPPPNTPGTNEAPHLRGFLAAQAALSAAQLNPAERLRSQNLRNAMTDIQQRLDLGWISPGEAQQLQHEVGAAAHPLWVRESQIPGLAMQLQFQQMQQQAAQQSAIENETAEARTTRVRRNTTTLPDGTQIYTSPSGTEHIIPQRPNPEAQERHRQTAQIDDLEQQHNDLVRRTHAAVQAEYDRAMAPRRRGANEESVEDFNARRALSWLRETENDRGTYLDAVALRTRNQVAAHYAASGLPSPVGRIQAFRAGNQQGGGQQGGGAAGGQPQGASAPPQPQAPYRPEQPETMSQQQHVIHQAFQAQRQTIENLSVPAARRQELQMARAEAQNLFQQYGSVPNMLSQNPIAHARYLLLVQQIQHAVSNRPRQAPLR